MTKIEGPVANTGIGLQGHGHPVRPAGDHLPVFDRDILAIVFRPQLRQQRRNARRSRSHAVSGGLTIERSGAGYSITSLMVFHPLSWQRLLFITC